MSEQFTSDEISLIICALKNRLVFLNEKGDDMIDTKIKDFIDGQIVLTKQTLEKAETFSRRSNTTIIKEKSFLSRTR